MSASLASYWALTKPGITRLVVFTTAAGFWVGGRGDVRVLALLATLVGTALVVSGTNALNQWWERDADARMARTRGRPLPAGKLPASHALRFGIGIAAAGIACLAALVNPLTASLALAALLVYVLAYTPLKRRSPLALYVGAVAGALPILGGWTATGAGLGPAAVALFSVLFCWQIPHFLALGWIYRDDYRAGGFAMLSRDDASGEQSARQAALFAAVLVVASLLPAWTGVAGVGYVPGALFLGALLLAWSLAMVRRPSRARARAVFIASVIYLPLLLLLLLFLPA